MSWLAELGLGRVIGLAILVAALYYVLDCPLLQEQEDKEKNR